MAVSESPGQVRHFRIPSRARFFSESDVGKTFMRTQPFQGSNWSFTVEKASEEWIKYNALKLVEYNPNSLKFQQNDPTDRNDGWKYVVLEKNWNDGNWMLAEKCIRHFASSQPPEPYSYWAVGPWD